MAASHPQSSLGTSQPRSGGISTPRDQPCYIPPQRWLHCPTSSPWYVPLQGWLYFHPHGTSPGTSNTRGGCIPPQGPALVRLIPSAAPLPPPPPRTSSGASHCGGRCLHTLTGTSPGRSHPRGGCTPPSTIPGTSHPRIGCLPLSRDQPAAVAGFPLAGTHPHASHPRGGCVPPPPPTCPSL